MEVKTSIAILMVAIAVVACAKKDKSTNGGANVRDTIRSDNGRNNGNSNKKRSVESILVTIPIEDRADLVLNLTTAENFNTSVPVILLEMGQTSSYQSDDEVAMYYDDEKMASFLMVKEKAEKGKSKMSYSATFMMEDGMYEIEAESIQDDTHPADDVIDSTMFVNMKTKKMKMNKMNTYDMHMEFEDDTQQRGNKKDEIKAKRNKRSTETVDVRAELVDNDLFSGSGKLVNNVELLVIIDYAAYRKRYEASTSHDHYRRHNDAIRSLKYFYFHVVHGIAMRYDSIQESDFSIYVRLSALIIATTQYDSPWTEQSESGIKDIYNNGHYTEVYQSIEFLEYWINTEENLPHFDHAMLFSANYLWNGYRGDGSRRTINGLSSIGQICNYMRASISGEGSLPATTITGAHELGHNLGAYHDSSYYGPCVGKDQFIMASGPAELTPDNYQNVFRFSQCSIDDFREHLFRIATSTGSCLLNNPRQYDTNDYEYYLQKFPGQVQDLDYQCQQIFGQDSKYCGGARYDAQVCIQMMCWHPRQRRCYTDAELRAAEGTTCGNGKWCMLNECVPDWRAPPARDTCIYGNYIDVIGNSGKTCPDLISYDPSQCYNQFYSADCCESCAAIRSDDKECPYGDRDPKFCRQISARECYDESTRGSCCKTCSDLMKSMISGCEYGDKASWCSNLRSYDCYVSSDICCDKCNTLCTGPAECPCGDRLSYCSNYEARECYDSNRAMDCCDHCAKLKTGPEGCPYGDRDKYCTKSDCNDQGRWESCCQTCADEIGAVQSAPGLTCPEQGNLVSWCSQIQNRDCYFDYYQDNCCSECKRYETGIKTCEFGNKVSWCPNYARTVEDCQRPEIAELCCATCYEIEGGSTPDEPKEEELEDYASWCPSIFPGQCYDENTESTCPKTCKTHELDSEYCRFGDYFSWCKTDYCSTDGEQCCVTCQ